jgi:hypothetical protein
MSGTTAPDNTQCAFAQFLAVQNHGGGMLANMGLVVHVQVGNGSLYGWFNNPSSEVSAHFWVGQGGELEQYIPIGTEAWAEMAGNEYYISIETEGVPTDPLTDDQVNTLARLIVWGYREFGWHLDLVDHGGWGITTHAHYPSGLADPAWGGHLCPGTIRSEQLPRVLTTAKQIVQGAHHRRSDMQYFSWQGKVYAASVGADNKGHAVELDENSLTALNAEVTAGWAHVMPDVQAGWYNKFVLGDAT